MEGETEVAAAGVVGVADDAEVVGVVVVVGVDAAIVDVAAVVGVASIAHPLVVVAVARCG